MRLVRVSVLVFIAGLLRVAPLLSQDQVSAGSGAPQVAKAVGTIKNIQAGSMTVTSSTGVETAATLSSSTRILRVLPGAKDLKDATPLQPQALQPGDVVRVRGYASADGHSINALEVIVFKQAEVAAKQQHDREDWQKRGIGGPVTSIDPAAGTVTISSGGFGASRKITVHIAGNTILRRYAPGSANIDAAKPAPLSQMKVGDQLNARGTRSADGSEMNADEVVFGTFEYVEGTIKAIDAANGTMTVQDPVRKSAVVVKVSTDSQMKKLPPEVAQRIAMRLKGASREGSGDQRNASGQGPQATGRLRAGSEGQAPRGADGGPGAAGPPDLQRMLNRLPNSTLAELQKDDAVMIVATASPDSGAMIAIKVLAGVDPILRGAPSGSASSLLSSWSLGGAGAEGEAAPQ